MATGNLGLRLCQTLEVRILREEEERKLMGWAASMSTDLHCQLAAVTGTIRDHKADESIIQELLKEQLS